MLENILNNVERINKKIHDISKFHFLNLSGVIILNEEWDSFGVILLDDEREILFSICDSGQLKALHESNQKLVSGLRLKILGLIELIEQRDSMFREFVVQMGDRSFNNYVNFAAEIENMG